MRADGSRQLQNITNQPVKLILHAVDNNILQNTPIIWEDVGMTEEIYGTSVPNLQGKTLHDKVLHVEPIILPNLPKIILDLYKSVALWCDRININGIGLLNTKYRQIIFSTGSLTKTRKLKSIEDETKPFNNLYLKCGFKNTHKHADREFEPLCA